MINSPASLAFIFTLVTGLCGAIWAILTKRKELAWKRTEFIVAQAQFLDRDPEMREGTAILHGRHPKFSIENYLDTFSHLRITNHETLHYVVVVDNYIEFLWRLAFARVVLKTLTTKDLWAFGVYFRRIYDHPRLKAHCKDNGWPEINKVCEMLTDQWIDEPVSSGWTHRITDRFKSVVRSRKGSGI